MDVGVWGSGNRTEALSASGNGCNANLGGSGCNWWCVQTGAYVLRIMGIVLMWLDMGRVVAHQWCDCCQIEPSEHRERIGCYEEVVRSGNHCHRQEWPLMTQT